MTYLRPFSCWPACCAMHAHMTHPPPHPRLYQTLALGCMVVAILSKESAFVFPFLLLALILSKCALSWRRFRVLLIFFAAAGILFVYRWSLFGGIGGYRDLQFGEPQVLSLGISTLKALAARLWAILYLPINWSEEPGLLLALAAIANMVCLLWLAGSRAKRSDLIFPLGFLLFTALPALHLLLIGEDLQKSRLLYMPSVGFCLMLASCLRYLQAGTRSTVAAGILFFHFLALQHNLNAWEYVSEKAKSACAAAVDCLGPSAGHVSLPGLPGSIRGVYFFANGFPECVEMAQTGRAWDPDRAAKLAWDPAKHELRCVPLEQGSNLRQWPR